VVGSSNRLAAAAARRVAELPGTTYNPLFVYSASGLGKTHLLTAIGHHAAALHNGLTPIYDTLEHLMEEVRLSVEAGERDALRTSLRDAGMLLLDDVQFLAGHRQIQEELLRAWDALSSHGAQVVLTSDRPPHEMDNLDERLLSRFSGGLIIDMAVPDYETRIAIVRRKARERDHELADGVPESLARIAFSNVRELQGALNRVIAVQELEQRQVSAVEVGTLLGTATARRGNDEFGEFLSEITGTVTEVVEEAERRAADAILRWEGAGYRTRRLEALLSGPSTPMRVQELVHRFEADAARLETIEAEIRALEPEAAELERMDVLRDPDRLTEAEALLAQVRERCRPLPEPPPGTFDDVGLAEDDLALRAAVAVAEEPGVKYNPLYVHGPAAETRAALTAAMANRMRELDPSVRVGYVGAEEFSRELIEGLERNHIEAWRARYRATQALFLVDVDRLAGTERSQEELFHLFDELNREGVQLVFTAAVPPQALELHARLRSRLESGLVVEPEAGQTPGGAAPETEGTAAAGGQQAPGEEASTAQPNGAGAGTVLTAPRPDADAGTEADPVVGGVVAGATPRQESGPDAAGEADAAGRAGVEIAEPESAEADATEADAAEARAAEAGATPGTESLEGAGDGVEEGPMERGGTGDWYLSQEKLVLIWPYTQDWLIEGME
ncbi:MAG: DnaA/Hda family protein, partial [Gemmatimonadota bacterium]